MRFEEQKAAQRRGSYFTLRTIFAWTIFFSLLVAVVYGLQSGNNANQSYDFFGRLIKANASGFGALILARFVFVRLQQAGEGRRFSLVLGCAIAGAAAGAAASETARILIGFAPLFPGRSGLVYSAASSGGIALLLGVGVYAIWMRAEAGITADRVSAAGVGTEYPSAFVQFFENRRPVSLALDELIYAEARGKRCILHLREGERVSGETLGNFALRLPPQDFVRIHKSYVVRKDAIHSIESGRGGPRLRLSGDEDESLPIGRAYLGAVESSLGLQPRQ